MSSRKCKTSPDCFCYVCGFYVGKKHTSHKIGKGGKYWTAYKLYFGMDIGDQDKPWAPHTTWGSCRSSLEGRLRGSRKCMPFVIPRIWREPQNHTDDCYFCMVNILKYRKVKGRKALTYSNIPSSIAPVSHNESLPVPSPPRNVSYAKLSFSKQCLDLKVIKRRNCIKEIVNLATNWQSSIRAYISLTMFMQYIINHLLY